MSAPTDFPEDQDVNNISEPIKKNPTVSEAFGAVVELFSLLKNDAERLKLIRLINTYFEFGDE